MSLRAIAAKTQEHNYYFGQWSACGAILEFAKQGTGFEDIDFTDPDVWMMFADR
jgi:hypothetical protein